jgi:hypothetical protein
MTITIKNASSLLCLNCRQEIMSVHRHDFVSCWCGDIYIDGGRDYTKTGWQDTAVYSSFVADWSFNVITSEKIRISDRQHEQFEHGRLASDKDKRRILDAYLDRMDAVKKQEAVKKEEK